MEHEKAIEALRAIADFYEKNIENPMLQPIDSWYLQYILSSSMYCAEGDMERAKAVKRDAKMFVTAFPKANKSYHNDILTITVPIPGTNMVLKREYPRTAVCRLVQTGETKKQKVTKCVQAAVYEEVEEEVPVTAYECSPLLAETPEKVE